MKAVVAAFNQEKALVRGLLRDCTTSPINRLQHLSIATATLGMLALFSFMTPTKVNSGDRKRSGPGDDKSAL